MKELKSIVHEIMEVAAVSDAAQLSMDKAIKTIKRTSRTQFEGNLRKAFNAYMGSSKLSEKSKHKVWALLSGEAPK